jgi:hypothetical protein
MESDAESKGPKKGDRLIRAEKLHGTRTSEKIRAFPAWNAVSIDERHDLLIGLAKDIWKTTSLVD